MTQEKAFTSSDPRGHIRGHSLPPEGTGAGHREAENPLAAEGGHTGGQHMGRGVEEAAGSRDGIDRHNARGVHLEAGSHPSVAEAANGI